MFELKQSSCKYIERYSVTFHASIQRYTNPAYNPPITVMPHPPRLVVGGGWWVVGGGWA